MKRWLKISILVLIVIIILAGVAYSYYSTEVVGFPLINLNQYQSYSLSVDGRDNLKQTYIYIPTDGNVDIYGSGEVNFNSNSAVSPDGYSRLDYPLDWPLDASLCLDSLWNNGHAALIAKIGDGQPFAVESYVSISKTQHDAGYLYLGINDCSLTEPEKYANSGQFNVNVVVSQ